ncbi:MAG: GAF domain-containing protein, partial [Anaerolineae bacterium]|nr:GAF domain-containing protein [Anaerolineae bacterium]
MNANTPATHPTPNTASHPVLRWSTPITAALAVLLLVAAPQLSVLASLLLVGVLCFVVFCAGLLLDTHQPSSPWPANRYLALLSLWLIAGWSWAVVLLLVALGLTFAIWRLLPRFAPASGLRHLRQAAISAGALLLVAETARMLLNAERPFNPLDSGALVRFTAACASGWLAAHAAARWDSVVSPGAAPFFSPTALNLYVFPLSIAFAAAYASVGVGVFAIFLLLLVRQAAQQQISGSAARRSDDLHSQNESLVRKLTLVNEMADNTLFGQEQPDAVKTTCETALAIAHADMAAIFLLNREENMLHLAEGIGFTPEQISAGQGLPYILEDARIVLDTAREGIAGPLAACLNTSRAYVQLPLRNGPLVHGYLLVAYHAPHRSPRSEIELLEALANHLAAALGNYELLEALEQHAFELSHLLYLSRISTSSMKFDQVSADVADVLRQIIDMDWSLIALAEEHKTEVRVLGVGHGAAQADSSFIPYSIQLPPELATLLNEHLPQPRIFQRDDTRSAALSLLMHQQRLRTLIAAPLLAREQVLGLILLGAQQTRTLTMREEQLLKTAVRQIATQIDNVRRYEQTYNDLERQLHQLSVIEDIVQRISSSHDFNAIIKDVFEAALNSTGADMIDLALLTEAQDWWVIEEYREGGESHRRFFNMPLVDGVIGLAHRTGKDILVPDNSRTPEYSPSPFVDYNSSLVIPLKRNNKEVIGAINVESKQPNFFNLGQADFLRNLGGHAIISIENTNLLDTLKHQIDLLTGLRALSLTIASATNTESVAQAVLNATLNLLDGQFAILFACDEQSAQLDVVEQVERDGAFRVSDKNAVFKQVAKQAMMTGEAQAVEDVLELYAEHIVDGVAYPSIIAVPIARGGAIRYVLCVAFEAGRRLEDREVNMVVQLAIQAAGHLHNAELHERILENNSRMRAILDSTRDGMVLLDDRGWLIEVNPAAQRLIGINLSDYLNEPFVKTLLNHIEADDDQSAGYSRDELKMLARIQRLEPEGITRREFMRQTKPNNVIYVEE